MDYTLPQKFLLEMDISRRRHERRSNESPSDRARYYTDLLRSGEIRLFHLMDAAVLGDQVAQKVVKSMGEDPPTIDEPADLLWMFGQTKSELILIFQTLYDKLRKWKSIRSSDRMTPTEQAAWAVGQIRNRGSEDTMMIDQIAHEAIYRIAQTVPLEKILEILRPEIIHPALR